MVKVLIVLTRRTDMSRDDFRRYWRDVHGPIGASMPGVRRYVQNHATLDGAPFDGLAEMWFDTAEDMQRAFTSPQAQEAAADTANFLSNTQVVLVEEAEMEIGN
jgi:uncharacterized protein (TIGR02118 family)